MMKKVTLRMRDDGPIVIEGDVHIVDAEGNEFSSPSEKPRVALCRCGHSASKPFCDGSHKRCGFHAADRALPEAGRES